MSRTRIKICGICRPEDAKVAVDAGADAIGMIRVKEAGRYIDFETAREIMKVLPPFVTPVVVYMNPHLDQILDDLPHLDHSCATVQLNGSESPELIHGLPHVTFIKAVRMDERAGSVLKQFRDAQLPNLVGVVLESPGQMGGSGVGNDWKLVQRLRAEGAFEGLPIIAAGGLTPENVGKVVGDIRPYAVDVSSGVESVKREKDAAKVKAFVTAVRSADAPP
jgi:phosphoribosylanthranilate isomerase